jgi:hypothetical protein
MNMNTSPERVNLYAAWIGILLGFVSGTVQGLFFHDPNWLGGYDSWTRRMLRLGHISFFGLAFIALAFVFSVFYLKLTGKNVVRSSWLFLLGQITMPIVCYLSAFHDELRYLFAIPVLSLIGGAVVFIYASLRA